VHDLFDWECIPNEAEGFTVMTTWHDDEPLREAIWFFANAASPDEGFSPDCTDLVAIAGFAVRLYGPSAIFAEGGGALVAGGRAGERELLLLVAEGLEAILAEVEDRVSEDQARVCRLGGVRTFGFGAAGEKQEGQAGAEHGLLHVHKCCARRFQAGAVGCQRQKQRLNAKDAEESAKGRGVRLQDGGGIGAKRDGTRRFASSLEW
jgi:hypothetical protein